MQPVQLFYAQLYINVQIGLAHPALPPPVLLLLLAHFILPLPLPAAPPRVFQIQKKKSTVGLFGKTLLLGSEKHLIHYLNQKSLNLNTVSRKKTKAQRRGRRIRSVLPLQEIRMHFLHNLELHTNCPPPPPHAVTRATVLCVNM